MRQPGYVRCERGTGIVHLGLGAFARAHLAEYTEEALDEGGDWRIAGVSLRSGDVRDRLAPQECLYTRVARADDSADYRVIGAVSEIVVAPWQPGRLAELLAAPSTRIVSLTVTEAGYCRAGSTGLLDLDHADIAHDVHGAGPLRSVIGMLADALARRATAGRPPFTVLSCDNLANNGALLRQLVLELMTASRRHERYADWVAGHVSFPSTMVDRIVPKIVEDDVDQVAASLGLTDRALVVTEPFRQWVVEDRFSAGRPDWERGGATMVNDVAPYELAKLRMLNASHSALAYIGLLADLTTVAQAVDGPLGDFIWAFMLREVIPTLAPSPIDLVAYAGDLHARFRNAALRHRLDQIATDGSLKLPQRLLPTLRAHRAAGGPTPGTDLILAAFVQHVTGVGLDRRPVAVADPLSAAFGRAAARSGAAPEALVPAILGLDAAFGSELVDDRETIDRVCRALHAIRRRGVLPTAAEAFRTGSRP